MNPADRILEHIHDEAVQLDEDGADLLYRAVANRCADALSCDLLFLARPDEEEEVA